MKRNTAPSHNGEDIKLALLFNGVLQDGFYIDVGAYCPDLNSNTYLLYQSGWRGLVIDPMFGLYKSFVEGWRDVRPRDIMIGALADAKIGERPFWVCDAVSQNSTGVEARAGGKPTAWVPTITLDRLWDDHSLSDVHVLSVDVEGMEQNVLYGLNLSTHRPWVMVIESRQYWDGSRFALWESRLLDSGYQAIHDDGSNTWYRAIEREDISSRWFDQQMKLISFSTASDGSLYAMADDGSLWIKTVDGWINTKLPVTAR